MPNCISHIEESSRILLARSTIASQVSHPIALLGLGHRFTGFHGDILRSSTGRHPCDSLYKLAVVPVGLYVLKYGRLSRNPMTLSAGHIGEICT